MLINIVKPTTKKEIDNVNWVEIETPMGNFVIQPDHAPMILTLSKDSQIKFNINVDKIELIPVKNGIAHITRSMVTFILSE